MSSISATGTLTQQLYRQLFDRLNIDGDDSLSIDELRARGGSSSDESASIFNTLDANSDGRVIRAEMTPSSAFRADTLASLLSAQGDGHVEDGAPSDAEILADLFARADLDGDGALNAAEMKAEGDLRRAANLDAGYISGPMFLPNDKNRDGLLTKDEIGVGRTIQTAILPAEAHHFFDELPEEDQKQFQALRERLGLPPLKPLTDEEKTIQRAQWAADAAERASGPEGTLTFLSREIDELRTKAADAFDSAGVSDTLTARLLQQILGEAWTTNEPA